MDARLPRKAADIFSLSAVDGQQRFQPEQRPLLPRCLTVRGAISMGILRRKCNAAAFHQRVDLLRICRRMQAAEKQLACPDQRPFLRRKLLDLGDRLIRKTGPLPAAALCINGVSCARDGFHLFRRTDHSVFALLRLTQNSQNHMLRLLSSNSFPVVLCFSIFIIQEK